MHTCANLLIYPLARATYIIYTHIHTYTHTHTHINTPNNTHTHTHTHINTPNNTHTHTHTHKMHTCANLLTHPLARAAAKSSRKVLELRRARR